MSAPTVTIQTALALAQAGRAAEAIEQARALVAREPENVDAIGLLGLLVFQSGAASEALVLLSRAVALRPNAPVLQFLLGSALRATGAPEEQAHAAFQKAVALQPGCADARLELGNSLKRLGRFEEAGAALLEATRLAPGNAAAWLNLGVAQLELGRASHAVDSFRRAVALEPDRAEAHNILGSALMENGDVAAAQASFRRALEWNPKLAAAHNNLARSHRANGKLDQAVGEYRAALAIAPDAATHSNLLYTLNFMPELSPEEIWREHAAWGERYAASLTRPAAAWEPPANRRLRIGFVSPDFVNHAVAYFFEPLIAALDRIEWEVFCYSDAPVPDRVTERLQGQSDHWLDSARLSDDALDKQIRSDRIDVLVDLAGHTARNRLLVFARKPAPMQLTWLGYPNTTGVSQIDYRLTDAWCDPVGQSDRWHSEKLLRLPNGFLCYRPPDGAPTVNDLPALRSECVTFASFSNYAKLSDPCVATWAEVLRAVPGSRLRLKSRGLADSEVVARLRGRFGAAGIEPDRILADGKLVSVHDHLAQYHDVDLALDPFPYNGTTTTCEALWMGIPVVTLAGATHVSRVGVSLMTRVGHPECIADTSEQYIAIAAALANDLPRLAEIRRALRPQMHRSSLCNAPQFAAEFTAAVRSVIAS